MSDSPQNAGPDPEQVQRPEPGQSPVLDNEQRYMALLALTSQELPAKAEDHRNEDADMNKAATDRHTKFQELDSDPAALEVFLTRERTRAYSSARQPARSKGVSLIEGLIERLTAWLPATSVRYAAAFGVAAIVSILVVTQLSDKASLVADVERSYSEAVYGSDRPSLVLPWEQPATAQGFAPSASNESRAAIDFAQGLIRGRELLAGATGAAVQTPYGALGEWNVLVSVACESPNLQSAEFWRSQTMLGERLAAASYDDKEAGAAIESHLAKTHSLLTSLAAGVTPARNARALSDELLLFREQFAPRDKAVLGGQ